MLYKFNPEAYLMRCLYRSILSFFLIGFMAMIFMTNAVVPIGVRNDSLSYLIISISIFLCSKKNSMFVTI